MARDLLNRANEFIGLDQKIWVVLETGGYGDAATGGTYPISTDAIEHVTAKVDFTIPREDSAARSGRSRVTRMSGKKECKFSFESYITPADPQGNGNPNLPDAHPMLLSCFGICDETDATKKVYKLKRGPDTSFRMLEEGTHFTRLAVGCAADTVTFSLPGDGKAMMKVEGLAQDVYLAGESVLTQAITGSAQTASRVIQDLTYSADIAGRTGNLISVAYTTGATAGAEVVTVTGNAISVQIETAVSTATQVKAAIDGSVAAAALVSVAISGTGAHAQTAPVAVGFLTGGLSANDIAITPGQDLRFEVGSYVDVIDKDDGNSVKVTARRVASKVVTATSVILTLSGGSLSAADAGDIVLGSAPDHDATHSEHALLGLKGSFSSAEVGAVQCDILSAEIAVKNNFTPRNNAYGTDKICGYLADKRREVSIKLDILLTNDNFEFYTKNKNFIADDLTITLAPQTIPAPIVEDATGRTLVFHLHKVEFEVPEIDQPSDGYLKLSLEGVALATSVNALDDEMTLTIQ